MTDQNSVIPIPIGDEILAAHSAGDHRRVSELLTASPIEAWYAITPDRLALILDAMPQDVVSTNIPAAVFRLLLGGAGGPARASRPTLAKDTDPRDMAEALAQAFGARLNGTPGDEAPAATKRAQARLTALFDEARGTGAFIAVQQGIWQLLRGDFVRALDSFAAATATPPPSTLTFLQRDAYVKSALVNALYGDRALAAAQLEISRTLPRTTSWAEHVVSAHAQIADALLSADTDLAAARDAIVRIPAALAGEMRPLLADAISRLHRQGMNLAAAEPYLRALRAASPTGGDGLPQSMFVVLEAEGAIGAGDIPRARQILADADPELIVTKLVRAALDIASGHTDRARRDLTRLHAETAALRQLEIIRTGLFVYATLQDGDTDTADAALARLAQLPGGLCRTEQLLLPVRVMRRAAHTQPGWPLLDILVDDHVELVTVTPRLTPRELRLLRMLTTQLSRAEIAEELYVSLNTVKSQQRSLFRKLGVASRDAAIAAAEVHGLL